MVISRKIIWIIVGIIVIVGAFVGLTILSNVTGNVITGGLVNTPEIEQETFKINNEVIEVGVIDGPKNSS